jgi:hypothetical protein
MAPLEKMKFRNPDDKMAASARHPSLKYLSVQELIRVQSWVRMSSVTVGYFKRGLLLRWRPFWCRDSRLHPQTTMYEIFCLKKWFLGLIVSPYSLLVFSTHLKND